MGESSVAQMSATAAAPAIKSRSSRGQTIKHILTSYPYLILALFFFIGWQILPIYSALSLSFTDDKFLDDQAPNFIGLQNYRDVLSDGLQKDQVGQLRRKLVRKAFARIVLSPTTITFHVQPQALLDLVAGVGSNVENNESALRGSEPETGASADEQSSEMIESSALPIDVIELPILIRRRGQEQRIVIESSVRHERDAGLVDAQHPFGFAWRSSLSREDTG